jgi:hypothetical protein
MRSRGWVGGCMCVCVCVRGGVGVGVGARERAFSFPTYRAYYPLGPYCLSSLAPPHFSNLSHKRQEFRINVTGEKINVLILPTISFEIFLLQKRIQREIIINVKKFLCKVSIILVRF